MNRQSTKPAWRPSETLPYRADAVTSRFHRDLMLSTATFISYADTEESFCSQLKYLFHYPLVRNIYKVVKQILNTVKCPTVHVCVYYITVVHYECIMLKITISCSLIDPLLKWGSLRCSFRPTVTVGSAVNWRPTSHWAEAQFRCLPDDWACQDVRSGEIRGKLRTFFPVINHLPVAAVQANPPG